MKGAERKHGHLNAPQVKPASTSLTGRTFSTQPRAALSALWGALCQPRQGELGAGCLEGLSGPAASSPLLVLCQCKQDAGGSAGRGLAVNQIKEYAGSVLCCPPKEMPVSLSVKGSLPTTPCLIISNSTLLLSKGDRRATGHSFNEGQGSGGSRGVVAASDPDQQPVCSQRVLRKR